MERDLIIDKLEKLRAGKGEPIIIVGGGTPEEIAKLQKRGKHELIINEVRNG